MPEVDAPDREGGYYSKLILFKNQNQYQDNAPVKLFCPHPPLSWALPGTSLFGWLPRSFYHFVSTLPRPN